MKVGVKILPKNEVLDSQGRAVEKTLGQHQIAINQCKVGKYVQLDVDAQTNEEALKQAHEIATFILHNPLIETFELEVLS